MTRPLTFAACLALSAAAFLPAAAIAGGQTLDTPPPAAAPGVIQGNAEQGRTLTYTCQGCHGVTGYKNAYPSFHVPKIGGQSAAYLTNALMQYRQGARKHPTMQAQAQGFSEQDIADIAAFLSTLK